jgi:hypothetical protein
MAATKTEFVAFRKPREMGMSSDSCSEPENLSRSAGQNLLRYRLDHLLVRTPDASLQPFLQFSELDFVCDLWLLHRRPKPRSGSDVNIE